MRESCVSGSPRAALGISFLFLAGGVLPWAAALADAPAPTQTAASAPSNTLYVARRGWHIDVGFDVNDLAEPLNSLVDGFP